MFLFMEKGRLRPPARESFANRHAVALAETATSPPSRNSLGCFYAVGSKEVPRIRPRRYFGVGFADTLLTVGPGLDCYPPAVLYSGPTLVELA